MNPLLGNRIIFVLALLGLYVSGHLTLAHLGVVGIPCSRDAAAGCEAVARHPTAMGFGIPLLSAIPTAAFGLLGYVAFAVLCIVRLSAPEATARKAADAQLALAGFSLLITAWLTYLEANVIHAWCQWCLASATLIVLIFITTLAERIAVRPVTGEAA
jgi:uncharacterized membrane protein